MHELCTDFNKEYDAVRGVVLLGGSAKLRKASTGNIYMQSNRIQKGFSE